MRDITRLIKRAAVEAVEASKPMAVVFGTVVGEAPLQIQVEQKLLLTKTQLVLTNQVADHKVTVRDDEQQQYDLVICNGLRQGDEVILQQMQGGQRFIVLDKVVKQ